MMEDKVNVFNKLFRIWNRTCTLFDGEVIIFFNNCKYSINYKKVNLN